MKKYKVLIFVVIAIGLISLSMLLYKTSYSYFISKRITETKETIVTGDLTSTLTITGLNLGDMEPMSDTDGMAQTNYATITINKNNIYKVFYKILIGYDYENVVDLETLLPMEYIHAAIYPINAGVVADNPLAGPVEITDLTVEEIEPTNVYTAKYFLAFDTLEEETQNQTKSYALKVWLKEGTPESYDSKVVNLDIGLKQETLISKSKYNISGVYKFSTLYGYSALTSLSLAQNNNITATLTPGEYSSQYYSIQNVPVGTYVLKMVYQNGNVEYEPIKIDSNGPVGGSVQNGELIRVNVGDYAPIVAYTYFSIPSQFGSYHNYFPNNYNHPAIEEGNFNSTSIISGPDVLETTNINNVSIIRCAWAIICNNCDCFE